MISQIYSIGDLAIITGANSSKTFPNGDSYYYYENDVDGDSVIDSISESYSSSQEFTDGGWSYANEGYLYYLDESNSRVINISSSSSVSKYDGLGRNIGYAYESQSRSDDGYSWLSNSTTTNTFASPESQQLSTSLEIYSSSDSNGYSFTTTNNISYAYADSNAGTYDYSSRRSVSAYDDKSDGVVDSVSYSLERHNRQGNSIETSSAGITLDSQGQLISSSRFTSTSTYSSGNNYSYSNSGVYASDWDGDGIIDHQNSAKSNSSYRNGKSASSYAYTSKYDYNEDGLADDAFGSTSKSRNGKTTTIDYDYDLSANINKNLSITKSIDRDGDGVFDSVKRRLVSVDIDDSFLSMGGHVATLQDTFI